MPLGRQDTEHKGFVAKDQWYDCAQCVAKHGELFSFPPLDPEHHDAWRIFQTAASQQRVGMDVIGLDYGALETVFNFYSVPDGDDRRILFERIAILNEMQQEDRARRAAMKAAQSGDEKTQRVLDGR